MQGVLGCMLLDAKQMCLINLHHRSSVQNLVNQVTTVVSYCEWHYQSKFGMFDENFSLF